MTNNCFRRHRRQFFRLQKIKRFSKKQIPKYFPNIFFNLEKWKNAEIWEKTVDFLKAFF